MVPVLRTLCYQHGADEKRGRQNLTVHLWCGAIPAVGPGYGWSSSFDWAAGVRNAKLRDEAPAYRTSSRQLRMRTAHDMT